MKKIALAILTAGFLSTTVYAAEGDMPPAVEVPKFAPKAEAPKRPYVGPKAEAPKPPYVEAGDMPPADEIPKVAPKAEAPKPSYVGPKAEAPKPPYVEAGDMPLDMPPAVEVVAPLGLNQQQADALRAELARKSQEKEAWKQAYLALTEKLQALGWTFLPPKHP